MPHRNIFVIGYSLGASVALAAGSRAPPIDAIVEWYGSMPDSFVEQIRSLPPLLILHGAKDSVIPLFNALQLQQLCIFRHLACSLQIYASQGHGFSGKALKDAKFRTLLFLNAHSR